MDINQFLGHIKKTLQPAASVYKKVGTDLAEGVSTQFTPIGMINRNLQLSQSNPEAVTKQQMSEIPDDLWKALKVIGYLTTPDQAVEGAVLGAGGKMAQNAWSDTGLTQDIQQGVESGMSTGAGIGALTKVLWPMIEASNLNVPVKQMYTTDKYLPYWLDALKSKLTGK